MNNLEALIIVRNCCLVSSQMHTRRGHTALKVVENKIQSLLRKKAWRDGAVGTIPVHMGVEDFKYPIPDDPVTAALRNLLKAEHASRDKFDAAEIDHLEAAMKQAEEALAILENTAPLPL